MLETLHRLEDNRQVEIHANAAYEAWHVERRAGGVPGQKLRDAPCRRTSLQAPGASLLMENFRDLVADVATGSPEFDDGERTLVIYRRRPALNHQRSWGAPPSATGSTSRSEGQARTDTNAGVGRGFTSDALLAIGESLGIVSAPTVMMVARKHLLSLRGGYARRLALTPTPSPASIRREVCRPKGRVHLPL